MFLIDSPVFISMTFGVCMSCSSILWGLAMFLLSTLRLACLALWLDSMDFDLTLE